MAVGSLTRIISCDGETIPAGGGATYATAGSGVEKHSIGGLNPVVFPAGFAGLSTENTGGGAVISGLATGHGITTANKVAAFWTIGGVNYYRIGMTVSAYTANSITVTYATGSGTAYPSGAAQAVVVSPAVALVDVSFTGSELNQLVVNSDQIAVADFLDGSSASLVANGISIGTANIPYCFIDSDTSVARPFTGVVASVNCYNGSIIDANLLIKCIFNT